MPGNTCFLCKSTWNHKISMFSLPTDDYLRGEWEDACGTKLPRNARLCARHFATEDFTMSSPRRTRLQPDAIPTLILPKKNDLTKEQRKGDKYKKNRATMEQLLYYVRFAKKNPIILTAKFSTVRYLWEDLAESLNQMGGVKRAPEKWRESMATWRSQLRCRARHGVCSYVPEFDEFAFATFDENSFKLPNAEEDASNENADLTTEYIPASKKVRYAEIKKKVATQDVMDADQEDPLTPDMDIEIKDENNLTDDDDGSAQNISNDNTNTENYEYEEENTFEPETGMTPKTDNELDYSDDDDSNSAQKNTFNAMNLPTKSLKNNKRSATTEDRSSHSRRQRISSTTDARKETCLSISQREGKSNTLTATTKRLETEEFEMDGGSQSPPSPQPSKNSLRRILATRNRMYYTLMKSIQKRDEREDEITNVLKGLTVAVTTLADNVKRLEETLNFSLNNY